MLITDFEKKPCRVQVLAVAGTLSRLTRSPEWPTDLCGPPAATWVAVHASRLHLATACHHRLLAPSSLALDSRFFLQKHATELQPRAARQAGADQLAHGTEGDSLQRDELRGREPRREPGGPSGSR